MKHSFLLQLFVLGFFLEAVLTSPLVARQEELSACPVGQQLTNCDIELNPPEKIDNIPPAYRCEESADCRYFGNSASCNPVNLECLPSGMWYSQFNCSTIANEANNQCGFTCKTCIVVNDRMNCRGCKGGIPSP
ncbi:hypothetical protein F8M41_004940 [Gigaspora margarita]|uniref:Uncharacterized protein n=1 Tax=Gigaspora margarita TaxID=4874 RepID=A0A8H3XBX2_GIGMA|nr:hypothetical protein F8M41_004940 [Gigaspora margarita]